MIKSSILTPFQKFVKIESFSGLLLLAATIFSYSLGKFALWRRYLAIWQYSGFKTETFELSKPLILWINDGLMAIFFFFDWVRKLNANFLLAS
ncbi:MAG: Na+/H+ antiporter NhaA [Flavobacteriaceae bacterium]